jgi:hypothetical protein
MKNTLMVSHEIVNNQDFGGTVEFVATNNGTSTTPIIDTQGAGGAEITTDGDSQTQIAWTDPINVATPLTWVNIPVDQEGGVMRALDGGIWNDTRALPSPNSSLTMLVDDGAFELSEGATFKVWGGVKIGGGTGQASLEVADGSSCRIITGVGQSTAQYLNISANALLDFTDQTAFGDLVYQNIEFTQGGVVNMQVAGGTSVFCNSLVPAGDTYGIPLSDANFAGGTLNITADNPPQNGFSCTLVTPDADASISNDFLKITKPPGTSHVFNTSKWTLTSP